VTRPPPLAPLPDPPYAGPMDAAIDRILHRALILRGGIATRAGDLRWDVSFPDDPDAEDGPTLAFQCVFTVQGDRVSAVHCDAPLDRYTEDQASAVAELHDDLEAALARERIRFDSFEALAAYLVEAGAQESEGSIEMPAGEESVFASVVPVSREPWVSLSIPFDDDADPSFLLEQNGNLTHVHFEAFDGAVSLACAFPLAHLTGERLLELIDDLASFRERLLDELDGDDDEG
jgi:hypothetical protein